MTNAGIYLNDHEIISYNNTNLPNNHFRFSQSRDIYWKVKPLINKQEDSTVIIIEVIDYDCIDMESFFKQKIKGELPFLKFINLDWAKFIGQLATYSPNYIDKSAFDTNSIDQLLIGTQSSLFNVGRTRGLDKTNISILPQSDNDTTTRSLELQITKSWSEVKIKDGYIEVTHNAKELNELLVIKVHNDILRHEYDLIKNYFAKRLGKKAIEIKTTINIEVLKIKHIYATSSDIDLINESLLEVIRQEQIRNLSKKTLADENKSLYTIDEALKKTDSTENNVLGLKIDDIIKVVTENFTHRNAKQIQYLAEKHLASEEVIRLTLKPKFGFVFYFKCKKHHHYAWELLSSHATYVWSFSLVNFSRVKSLELLESIINEIHLYGREPYRKKHKLNGDYEFVAISHKLDVDENPIFEQWRLKLNSL
jgi:hypothetical protein